MEAFLKNQFSHDGRDGATAMRVTTGVAEPTYAFDVTTTGGSPFAAGRTRPRSSLGA